MPGEIVRGVTRVKEWRRHVIRMLRERLMFIFAIKKG